MDPLSTPTRRKSTTEINYIRYYNQVILNIKRSYTFVIPTSFKSIIYKLESEGYFISCIDKINNEYVGYYNNDFIANQFNKIYNISK